MSTKRKVSGEGPSDLLRKTKILKVSSDSEGDDCILLEKIINKPRNRKLTITWPDHDVNELLKRIRNNIPENDKLVYKERLREIQWEDVRFKNYSVEECQRTWSILLRQIRKHRILSEIIDDMSYWVSNPRLPRQKLIKVHPEFPKAVPNAFTIFLIDKKDEVIQDNPGLPFGKIVQKCANIYNILSVDKRQKYNDLAQKLREDYSNRVKEFYMSHPEYIPLDKDTPLLREIYEFDKPPETPKTPFCLFFEGKLQNIDPGLSKAEFKKQCRKEWDSLDDKNKLFWINWALEQFQRYKIEEKNYRKTHPQYKIIETILTKKELELKEKQTKPRRPPRSGFDLFRNTLLKETELQILPLAQRISYIAAQWHDCPDDEKNIYITRCQQMWQKYCEDVEEYLLQFPEYQRDELRKEALKGHWKHIEKKKKIEEGGKIKKINEPKMPPKTAFDYFVAEHGGENPEEEWENLSDSEKKLIEKKLHKKKVTYMELFEKFLKGLSENELEEYYKK